MTAERIRLWPDLLERIKATSRAETGGWLTGFKGQEEVTLLHLSGPSQSEQYGEQYPHKVIMRDLYFPHICLNSPFQTCQQSKLLSRDLLASADRLQRLLPAGVSICGAWARGGEEQDALQRLKKMATAAQAKVHLLFCSAMSCVRHCLEESRMESLYLCVLGTLLVRQRPMA